MLHHEDVEELCINRGEQIVRLKHTVADLLVVLGLAEQGSEGLCPACLEWYENHEPGCKLVAAITKANKELLKTL